MRLKHSKWFAQEQFSAAHLNRGSRDPPCFTEGKSEDRVHRGLGSCLVTDDDLPGWGGDGGGKWEGRKPFSS